MTIDDLPQPLQDWLLELEGFHLRAERLFEEAKTDFQDRPLRVLDWLQVAYELGQRNASAPVAQAVTAEPPEVVKHDDGLVRCPLCGADQGYHLADGETYRWWRVQCASCGGEVSECRSNRETRLDAAKPERWAPADEAWNDAGAHAQKLREALLGLPGGAALLASIEPASSTP